MPKKSNATRADGRIGVRVYLGIVDGKKKYKYCYGKTQKEADAKAKEIRLKLGLGVDILSENTPWKTYREMWLKEKRVTVSESSYPTYIGYSNTWKTLDSTPISKVAEHHIQSVIDDLFLYNPNTGKQTAKKTLISTRAAASQILRIAIRNGAIVRNVADGVVIPAKAPTNKRGALTDEQIKWIEDTPHRAQLPCMLMLYAGLRRGELFALTWNNIDLKNATITVNQSVTINGNKSTVKNSTKTESGMRTVYIPDKLVNYLSNVKRTSLFVCPTVGGKVMTKSAWSALWESYMLDLDAKYSNRIDKKSKFAKNGKKKAKKDGKKPPQIITIDTFTPHMLRHTFATMLYQSGVDVLTAKEQLGHADIKTTLSIYTHLDGVYKKKEISKLNEYLKCGSDVGQTNPAAVEK